MIVKSVCPFLGALSLKRGGVTTREMYSWGHLRVPGGSHFFSLRRFFQLPHGNRGLRYKSPALAVSDGTKAATVHPHNVLPAIF